MRIRCSDGERGGDGCSFAREALCVEAGTAATNRLGREAGEGGKQSGGDGCVADSDLAENENVAPFGKCLCKLVPGLGGGLELLLSECRAERDVGAAVGDAPIGEFGNAWAGEADIDDLQFCLVGVGEHADRCLLPCCGGGDLRSDTCGIEADSVPGDAVVGGEDEDADPWLRRGWRTCCDRPPFEK